MTRKRNKKGGGVGMFGGLIGVKNKGRVRSKAYIGKSGLILFK